MNVPVSNFLFAFVMVLAGVVGAARPAAAQSGTNLQFFLGVDAAAALFGDYEASPGDDVDDADFSWMVFGGVRYGYVGASFGYTDLGELEASGPSNGGFTDEIDYDGYTLVAHGFLPLGDRFVLTAEGGALFWDQKVRYVDSLGRFRANETGVSGVAGVGAGFLLVPEMGISLTFRYTHYFEVGDAAETGHDSDIDRIGVGVAVGF
jgi:hypothetical protein